ncbi:MAG: ATP-binding protein [Elusimicrobiota bacterium]
MSAGKSPWSVHRSFGDDTLVFRLLIAFLLLVFAVFPPAGARSASWPVYAVIALYVLTLLYLFRRERRQRGLREWSPLTGSLIDIVAITGVQLGLHAGGSDLCLAYVIAILISVKRMDFRHNLSVGIAACAGYGLSLFQYTHRSEVLTSGFLMRFPFLVVVSAFTMLLSQKLKKARDAQRDANTRLREVNETLEERVRSGTRDLRKAVVRLQLMNDLMQDAMRLESLEQLWPLLSAHLKLALACERATFFVQNAQGDLDSIYADNMNEPIHLPRGKGLAGAGAKLKKPLIINDPYNHPDFVVKVDVQSGFRTQNVLACPLVRDEEVTGVAEFINKEGGFTEEDAETLLYVAPGIQILYDKLKGDTDRGIMQASLTQSEKFAALGRLMAGMSHEIRNPLTAILANAQLLLRRSGVEGESREMLEDIEHCTRHCEELLTSLLVFARKSPKEKSPHGIDGIIEHSLKLFGKRFAVSGIEVKRTSAPGEPAVMCDAVQLQQVIVNILGNAQQAMAEGGVVTLTTSVAAQRDFRAGRARAAGRRDSATDSHPPGSLKSVLTAGGAAAPDTPSFVVLDIDDSGAGILPEARDKLFDPFFTTKEPGAGTGLGLSVSREIVEQHGGLLLCGDNPSGQGARFTIALPRHRDAAT